VRAASVILSAYTLSLVECPNGKSSDDLRSKDAYKRRTTRGSVQINASWQTTQSSLEQIHHLHWMSPNSSLVNNVKTTREYDILRRQHLQLRIDEQSSGSKNTARQISRDFHRATYYAGRYKHEKYVCPSVCPAVHPSVNACILTKRKNLLHIFLYHTKGR